MTAPVVEAMLAGMVPDAARQVISAWLHTALSAPITILRLLMILEEPQPVVALLGRIVEGTMATFPPASQAYQKAAAMRQLLKGERAGVDLIGHLLRLERQCQGSWLADPIAGAAALFDP